MSFRVRLMLLGFILFIFFIAISVSPIPELNFKDFFGGYLPVIFFAIFLIGWFQGFFQGD